MSRRGQRDIVSQIDQAIGRYARFRGAHPGNRFDPQRSGVHSIQTQLQLQRPLRHSATYHVLVRRAADEELEEGKMQRRKGGKRGGERFFHVSVPLKKGDDYTKFYKKFKKAVETDHYPDDEFDNDFDVYGADIAVQGDADDVMNLVDDDEEEKHAYHQFRKDKVEQLFSIQRLRVKDVPCIFESLMIIQYYVQFGSAPPAVNDYWIEFVLANLISEDFHYQQVMWEGNINEALELFTKYTKIKVELFDCCQATISFQQLKDRADAGFEIPFYYLAYWAEHTFPVTYERLPELVNFFETKYKDSSYDDKLFCVVPRILNTLHTEIYLYNLLPRNENQFLFQQLGISVKDMAFTHFKHTDLQLRSKQYYIKKRLADYRNISDQNFLEDVRLHDADIAGHLQQDVEAVTTQMKRRLEVGLCKHPVHLPIDPEQPEIPEDVQKVIDGRKNNFDTIGLITIDEETCMDNSQSISVYNMRPYMISFYGRLVQVYQDVNSNGQKYLRKRMVYFNEPHVFIGIEKQDCIVKFVRFLIENNYCYQDQDYSVLENDFNHNNDKVPRVFNYIFAHNGFGFDFRFLYEELHKQLAGFRIVGDMSRTKILEGNGLFFYDFFLIYQQSLESLGKTFFPNDPSMHKDKCDQVKSLTVAQFKEMYAQGEDQEELQKIAKYCKQDSYMLWFIVEKFFKKTYSSPFGHAFLPKMFYHSSSALAWDMFTCCFLKRPLFVNQYTQHVEQSMKIGGFCQTYRPNCGFGVSIDVNSFYPAVMQNMFPLIYLFNGANDSIQQCEWRLTTQNYQDNIKPHNIYAVKFRFDESVNLPTICSKVADTLVMTRESNNYEGEADDDSLQWVYGDTLLVAFETCGSSFECKVFKHIDFESDYIHNEFINYFYKRRLVAKRNADAVDDKFCKDMMNQHFGKYGQNYYMKTLFGSRESIRDWAHIVYQQKNTKDLSATQILSNDIPLYQMRYSKEGDELYHKGTLVRFSAFIMGIARNHLMVIKHAIANIVGADSIVYCDTDSVFVSFDKFAPGDNYLAQEYMSQVVEGREKGYSQQYLDEIGARALQFIKSRPYFKKLTELQTRDVRKIHDRNARCNLIDDKELGACKIERFILGGNFMGSKQYEITYVNPDGSVKSAVKIRGVQRGKMDPQFIKTMATNLGEQGLGMSQNWDSLPMFNVEVDLWSRMGAGVILSSISKIGRPTLYKRVYDYQTMTSRPHNTFEQVKNFKKEYNKKMDSVKSNYRSQLEEIFLFISEKDENLARSQAMKKSIDLRGNSQAEYEQMKLMHIEQRKKFVMRLPKIKFDSIQDHILEKFLSDKLFFFTSQLYLPKIICIISKAVMKKKTKTKSSVSSICDNLEGKFGNLSQDQISRIISFCLFLRYYLHEHNMHNKNLDRICEGLAYNLYNFIDIGPDDQQSSQEQNVRDSSKQWRKMVVYALQFLAAPICIRDEGQQIVQCTTLWRVMNNLHSQAGLLAQEDLISGATLENLNQRWVDKRAIITGEQYRMRYMPEADTFNFIAETPVHGIADEAIRYGNESRSLELNDNEVDTMGADSRMAREVRQHAIIRDQLRQTHTDLQSRQQHTFLKIFFMQESFVNVNSEHQREELLRTFFADNTYVNNSRLYEVFGYSRGIENKEFFRTPDCAIDFLQFVQFLYYGHADAIRAIRTIFKEWTQANGVKDNFMAFIYSVRIAYQKWSMFKIFKKWDVARKHKFGKLMEELRKLCMIANQEELKELGQEVVRAQLMTIINNDRIVSSSLRNLVMNVLFYNEEAIQIGQSTCQRLLAWLNPSKEMLGRLKAILLVKDDIKYDCPQSLEQQMTAYIEKNKTDLNAFILEKMNKDNENDQMPNLDDSFMSLVYQRPQCEYGDLQQPPTPPNEFQQHVQRGFKLEDYEEEKSFNQIMENEMNMDLDMQQQMFLQRNQQLTKHIVDDFKPKGFFGNDSEERHFMKQVEKEKKLKRTYNQAFGMYGMNPFEIEAEEDDDAKSEPNSMDLSEPLF